MRQVRFSLGGLMMVVALIAVACAAIRPANEFWASAMFSLALICLLVALMGVVFQRGAQRAFWIGFCVFGWSYLALVFAPGLSKHMGPGLLMSRGVIFVRLKLQEWIGPQWSGSKPMNRWWEAEMYFDMVAHPLLVLLFGQVGGVLARWFFRSGLDSELPMRQLKFSLRGLYITVALIVVACAAIRLANEFWASTMFTVAVIWLLVAVLGAVFRRGAQRAFWIGFCVFGWGYLMLVFAPVFNKEVGPRLVTSRWVNSKRPKFQEWFGPQWAGAKTMYRWMEVDLYFDIIAHSLFALLLAHAGGAVARRFFHSSLGPTAGQVPSGP